MSHVIVGKSPDAEKKTEAPAQSRGARSERRGWAPLPRRAVRRPHSPLVSIRTPISKRARWILRVCSLAVPLLAWWVLTATELVPATILPSPGAAFAAGWEMATTGTLFTDLGVSTERVLFGFGLAVLISVPIGLIMGTFLAGEALFEPLFAMLRYLPAPAFVPLFLVWFGIDETPKIALVFIGTFFFNTMMIADVVRSVPRQLIDVSYTLGARRGEVLRKVILPHSLPGMIDTIRINIAAAWALLVVAEVVAADSGLGRAAMQTQRFRQIDKVFAILVVIGIVGVILDVTLRLLRSRVGRWAS